MLALNRFLDHPPAHRDAELREAGRLDGLCRGGLRSLALNDAQDAALMECGRRFNRYCRGTDPDDRRQGVYLCGPEGCGKTAHLQALVYDLLHRTGPVPYDPPHVAYPHSARPVSAVYWSAAELFRQAKKAFRSNDEAAAAIFAEAVNVQVLALDNLEGLPRSVWLSDEWNSLMEVRHANGRPTCFSASETWEDGKARLRQGMPADQFQQLNRAFSRVDNRIVVVELGAPEKSWHEQPTQTRTPASAPFFTTWPDRREVRA